jgi:hypothetical protein
VRTTPLLQVRRSVQRGCDTLTQVSDGEIALKAQELPHLIGGMIVVHPQTMGRYSQTDCASPILSIYHLVVRFGRQPITLEMLFPVLLTILIAVRLAPIANPSVALVLSTIKVFSLLALDRAESL